MVTQMHESPQQPGDHSTRTHVDMEIDLKLECDESYDTEEKCDESYIIEEESDESYTTEEEFSDSDVVDHVKSVKPHTWKRNDLSLANKYEVVKLLEQKLLRQKDIAIKLGCSQSQVSNIWAARENIKSRFESSTDVHRKRRRISKTVEQVGYVTHSSPSTTVTTVPYVNSLDPDETPSNSASHPDPSCLTLRLKDQVSSISSEHAAVDGMDRSKHMWTAVTQGDIKSEHKSKTDVHRKLQQVSKATEEEEALSTEEEKKEADEVGHSKDHINSKAKKVHSEHSATDELDCSKHNCEHKKAGGMDCSKHDSEHSVADRIDCSKHNSEHKKAGGMDCSKHDSEHSVADRIDCSKHDSEHKKAGCMDCSKHGIASRCKPGRYKPQRLKKRVLSKPVRKKIPPKHTRKDLSLADRYKAVTMLEQKLPQAVIAKQLGCSQSQVSRISTQREDIKSRFKLTVDPQRRRQRSGKAPIVEDALSAWFKNACSQNLPISGAVLEEKSIELAHQLGKDDFKPSVGWLARWKNRHAVAFKQLQSKQKTEDTLDKSDDNNAVLSESPILSSLCNVSETLQSEDKTEYGMDWSNDGSELTTADETDCSKDCIEHDTPDGMGHSKYGIDAGCERVNSKKKRTDSKSARTMKKLSLEDKYKAVTMLEQNMQQEDIAKKFGCSQAKVSRISSKREDIKTRYDCTVNLQKNRQQLDKAPEVADALSVWFMNACTQNLPISSQNLEQKAIELAHKLNRDDFNPSKCWLACWKNCHAVAFKQLPNKHREADIVGDFNYQNDRLSEPLHSEDRTADGMDCSIDKNEHSKKKTPDESAHSKPVCSDMPHKYARKDLSLADKYKAVTMLEQKLLQADIAKKLGCSQPQISHISKQREDIKSRYDSTVNLQIKRQRLHVDKAPEVGDALSIWFLNACAQNLRVSSSILQKQATNISRQLNRDDLKISSYWLGRWKKRHATAMKQFEAKLKVLDEIDNPKDESTRTNAHKHNERTKADETHVNCSKDSSSLALKCMHSELEDSGEIEPSKDDRTLTPKQSHGGQTEEGETANFDSQSSATSVKWKRNDLSLADKYEVVKLLEQNMPQVEIALKFACSQSQVSRASKQRESIRYKFESNAYSDRKRLRYYGKAPDVEDALSHWYTDACTHNLPRSDEVLKQKALDFARQLKRDDFKPSKGWLSRWKDRHSLWLSRWKDRHSVHDKSCATEAPETED